MIIAVSGIDGAGKTTQIDALLKYFKSKNIKAVRLWSRGGYTPLYCLLKSAIRYFLKKKLPPSGKTEKREKMLQSKRISGVWLTIAIVDLIVFYAFYMRIVNHLFRTTVIADRYLMDTLIDFRINFKNVRFYKWILWKVLVFVAPRPSHSFLLTISYKEAELRAELKKEPFADSDKIRKLRYRYYNRLRYPLWEKVNCHENVEIVTNKMIAQIEQL